MAELRANGIAFDENIELGGMIEVPAAAMAVATFLNHLDFVSIGTNDLIQYSLAVDRNDDAVSHLYDPLNPGVLQLLHHVISTANRIGKPVSMCGEMAGDPSLSRLLLGLGLRRFSMLPIQLLKVKQLILSAEMDYIRPIVAQMLAAEDSERLRDLLQDLNR
jgi:phosphotransferase system enzyme I (PtsI)